jgi:Dyp-type peroxidase family
VTVDLDDLQGNVLAGYGFEHARYVGLAIDDPGAGRTLLAALAADVMPAAPWPEGAKPDVAVNVAIAYAGLRALGVAPDALAAFPQPLREGMAARAGLLGDTGASAPEHWEPGLRGGELHALVSVTARTAGALRAHDLPLGEGVRVVWDQHAAALPGGREHFGFADGFAQPAIRDPIAGPSRGHGTVHPNGRWRDVEPGEFVLGQPNEDGDPAPAPGGPLGRNGTYMVLRKLHQDVALFNAYLRDAAGGDPALEELLAAKVVGRWRDGTPLALSPDRPDPAIAGDRDRINDFRYAGDEAGLRCPLGAHVRRTNPRDAFVGDGRLTARHRIVRRGMPYGPPPADRYAGDGVDRGLIFVCFQASLERQFETIQRLWVMDGDAFCVGDDRDLLLAEEDPEGKMTIPGDPPRFLSPYRSFVTTRGGEYLFVPGRSALRLLAQGEAAG